MLRVRTVFTGVAGSPYYSNIFYDQLPSAAEDAADAIGTAWEAMEPFMDNAISWVVESTVMVMDPVTGQPTDAVTVTGLSGTGSSAVDALPRAVQGLVQLRTGVFNAGREIRGRIFLPGLVVTTADLSGVISAGTVTAFEGIWEGALLTTPGVPTAGVWSRSGGIIEQVSSVSVWDEFAVLRSRRD